MAFGFGGSSMDPLADYESPMYGPYPDFGTADYSNPADAVTPGGSAGTHQGYTPMGALLLGDNVYNIAVAVAQWIRLIRPLD